MGTIRGPATGGTLVTIESVCFRTVDPLGAGNAFVLNRLMWMNVRCQFDLFRVPAIYLSDRLFGCVSPGVSSAKTVPFQLYVGTDPWGPATTYTYEAMLFDVYNGICI